jgi:hypothetical protein
VTRPSKSTQIYPDLKFREWSLWPQVSGYRDKDQTTFYSECFDFNLHLKKKEQVRHLRKIRFIFSRLERERERERERGGTYLKSGGSGVTHPSLFYAQVK